MLPLLRYDKEERWHMLRQSTLYASNISIILLAPWFLRWVGHASHTMCLFVSNVCILIMNGLFVVHISWHVVGMYYRLWRGCIWWFFFRASRIYDVAAIDFIKVFVANWSNYVVSTMYWWFDVLLLIPHGLCCCFLRGESMCSSYYFCCLLSCFHGRYMLVL